MVTAKTSMTFVYTSRPGQGCRATSCTTSASDATVASGSVVGGENSNPSGAICAIVLLLKR